MGIMTAMAIALALLMELFFLPALLLRGEKHVGPGANREPAFSIQRH
jgi:predicted RND superfamily exporter protein